MYKSPRLPKGRHTRNQTAPFRKKSAHNAGGCRTDAGSIKVKAEKIGAEELNVFRIITHTVAHAAGFGGYGACVGQEKTAGYSVYVFRLDAVDGHGIFLRRLVERVAAEHGAALAAVRQRVKAFGLKLAAVRGGMYARNELVRICGAGCVQHGEVRRNAESAAAHPRIGVYAALTGAREEHRRVRIGNVVEIDADIFRIAHLAREALVPVYVQENGEP